jgi:hypothetical protein
MEIKRIITNLITTGVLLGSFIIFLGSLMVYEKTGYFGFHWDVIKYILVNDIQYLLGIIMALLAVIYAITVYYRRVLAERKNCQVTYVDLSAIAVNWVRFENIEENIKEKLESKTMSDIAQTVYSENEERINKRYPELLIQNSRDLIDEFVFPNAKRFDTNEIDIIYDLLVLLEENIDVSSVAYLYEKDPEIMVYHTKNTVTIDGKTSYDILKTYTLYDHTLRVVNTALGMNDQSNQSINKFVMLGRIIISTLSHDIGKITASENKTKINGQFFHQQPHEMISAMMIREMYPEYKNIEQVVKAIRAHHGGKADDSLAILLKDADKKAREIEISEWHISNKLNRNQRENDLKDVKESEGQETQKVQSSVVIDTEVIENKELENQKQFVDEIFNETSEISKPKDVKRIATKNNPVEVKKDLLRASTEKEQPVKKPKADKKIKNLEYEYDFVEAHAQEIKEYLQKNINKTETNAVTLLTKTVSASYKNVVFFEYLFFKDMLQKIIKATLNDNALNMIFKQLKEADIISMINTAENYKVSRISIKNSQDTEKLSAVPVKINFLGYTLEEIEETKKNNPLLRNAVVELYSQKS